MRRHAGIGALLLIGIGIGIGASVFRSDIAQATGLAQSVTVNNTAAQAVPVREQNLDGGNVKVHEQGIPSVRQAGTRIRVSLESLHHSYVVPAGKRLVIEYVSGFVGNDGPSTDFIELDVLNADDTSITAAIFPAEPIHDSTETFSVNRETRIYMSAGEKVELNPFRAFVTLYGTLDDA
jgi:hypothetical protein